MAVQSNVYTIGSSLTYASTKSIPTKEHMAVWVSLEVEGESIWTQLQQGEYDLINNSAVIKESVVLSQYNEIEIRVADTPDELTQSASDISIVAGIAQEVADVAFIAEEVVKVANNEVNINSVVANEDNINTVANNVIDVNTVADNINSVISVSNNMTDINNAEDNAQIAIDKAAEASASATTAGNAATSALSSKDDAKLSEDNAKVSETNAKTSETNSAISEANALVYRNESKGFRDEAQVIVEDRVAKTSDTGSAVLPTGDLSQRDIIPQDGYLRYNNETNEFEGYKNGQWGSIGGEMGLGFKNLIINGDKRVNQRSYADGVLADGVYGYDRWKGANSDANIQQVIEQQNIETGTYAISWVGGGTATVNGVSGLSSGDSLNLTVASDVSVIVPKGATNIQLEKGSTATSFEQRPIALELSLCQRYFYSTGGEVTPQHIATGQVDGASSFFVLQVPSVMRVIPTLTISALSDFGVNDGIAQVTPSVFAIFRSGKRNISINLTVAGLVDGNAGLLLTTNANARLNLDAEL